MIRKLVTSAVAIAALSGSALAADLPSRAEPPVYTPPPPPPIFTWTGFYVGLHIGYQWGNNNFSTPFPVDAAGFIVTSPSNRLEGVIGGGQVGYNYQINQFVIGIEGDVDGTGVQRSAVDPTGTLSTSTRIPVEGSIRGRIGYAWDRVLFYGTGGLAIGDITTHLTNNFTGVTDRFSATRIGWTVGGGAEYAITSNWLLRGEYRYSNYGTISNVDVNGVFFGGPFNLRRHETDNRVTVGFDYLFSPPPPPAPPLVTKY